MSPTCHARQYSDQMVCHKCGLTWDMNDPDPPECNHGKHIGPKPTFKRSTNNQPAVEPTTKEQIK